MDIANTKMQVIFQKQSDKTVFWQLGKNNKTLVGHNPIGWDRPTQSTNEM